MIVQPSRCHSLHWTMLLAPGIFAKPFFHLFCNVVHVPGYCPLVHNLSVSFIYTLIGPRHWEEFQRLDWRIHSIIIRVKEIKVDASCSFRNTPDCIIGNGIKKKKKNASFLVKFYDISLAPVPGITQSHSFSRLE